MMTRSRTLPAPGWSPALTDARCRIETVESMAMKKTSAAPERVVLRGGLTVPQAAVDLLLDLERRELNVQVDSQGQVVCRGGRLLTDDDKRAIAAFRDPLKALISYCEAMH